MASASSSAGSFGEALRFAAAQDGEKVRRRGLAGIVLVAAQPDVLFGGICGLSSMVCRYGYCGGRCFFSAASSARRSIEMRFPGAGKEAVELAVAVVQDAFARAEEVFPEHEFVAIAARRDWPG